MELVFATHNLNKLAEVKGIMPKHIKLLSLEDIGCMEDIEEYGETIEENAIIKAKYVYDHFKLNCFADDTGLEVTALNNAPGVYSARYAGKQKNAETNMDKLLQELKAHNNRSAKFKTVIALYTNENMTLFEGIVNGVITEEKFGTNGFGYDPIFQPDGYAKTFAELTSEEKSNTSHRARAIKKLIDHLIAQR